MYNLSEAPFEYTAKICLRMLRLGYCLTPYQRRGYITAMLTYANLHMSRFAHMSKSKFAMRSDESYVP